LGKLDGWCFDIEANGLYLQATKCWYIKFKSMDGEREMQLFPFREDTKVVKRKIEKWIDSFDDGAHVVGFNHLGFDLWALWKFFGIKPRVGKNSKDWLGDKHVQYVDGYILSQYLHPDSPRHSLDYLSNGKDSNDEEGKLDYRQSLIDVGALEKDAPKGAEFLFYHDLLIPYCDRDVDATINVVNRLWAKAKELYKDEWLHPSFRQLQKDYWLYNAQEYAGVKFNKEKAEKLAAHCQEQMDKLRAEVEPLLPPRPLKASEQLYYKMPSKPFKKNGEPSTALVNWLAKHNAMFEDGWLTAYGKRCELKANEIFPVELPMEIDDNVELKDWFTQAGWIPSDGYWNYKKDPVTGKPMRDENRKLIPTTPKIQNAGVICPNLLKLEGEIPKKVVKFLSYRNRQGVVLGWLNNWRLSWDGRIGASITGYTPTFRVKHSVIVNCPKADEKVLLGHEMRDLFEVEKGKWYNGCDAAALENRTVAQYTKKYDGGKFAELVLNGDSHSFNAFAFFPKLHDKFNITDATLKDNPEFKPWRNLSKTGAYLLAYGGGEAKLASSLNLTKKEGKRAYDNYWEMNAGLGKFKEAAEKYYEGKGQSKYLPAIDGRLLSIRGKNVIVNCLGQSCGAIAMSYAACLMDNWLGELEIDSKGRPFYLYKGKVVKRISMVHDEYSFEVEDGVEEEVNSLMELAIVKAGEILKLSVPLAAEGKKSFEGSWKDVH
jgi:hypothetical protein